MRPPPTHPEETARLAAVEAYGILDTSPEPGLNDLVELAAEICGAPMSLISIIGEDRQFFKARFGLDTQEPPKDVSFCTHAILQDELYEVTDATMHPTFHDNPLVTDDPRLRFYAGVPLHSKDGLALGTLCVLDTKPKSLTAGQKKALKTLANEVVAHLELRRQAQDASNARGDTERALSFLRFLTDSLPVRVAYLDRDYRYVFVNDEYERALGKRREELEGKTVSDAMSELVFTSTKHLLDRAMRGERFSSELKVPYPSGAQWIQATYVPDFEADGSVKGIVCHVQNVTEFHDTEQLLDKERYRQTRTLQRAQVATYDWDIKSDRVFGNSLFNRFFGLPDDVAGLPSAQCFAAMRLEDRAPTLARLQESLQSGELYEAQYRVVGVDGIERTLLARGDSELDDKGVARWLSGVVLDVTDRVASEEALREAKLYIDALLTSAEVGIWDYSAATGLVTGDPIMVGIFGLDRSEATPQQFIECIHPDYRAAVWTAFSNTLETGEPYEMEYYVGKHPQLWVVARGFAKQNASGKVGHVAGIVVDITDQKKSEQELRKATARLTTALGAAQLGTFEWNLLNGEVVMDPRSSQIFGFDSNSCVTFEDIEGRIHPDDLPRMRAEAMASISDASRLETEYRLLLPDHTARTVISSSDIIVNDAGVAERMVGSFSDVTEKRQSEIALAESEELFRQLVDLAPATVWVGEIDGGLSYISQDFYDASGLTPETALPNGWASIVHTDDLPTVARQWEDARTNESLYDTEFRIRHKDGHYRWISARAVPVRDAEGKVTSWLGSNSDIHERKAAEEILQAAVAERTKDLQKAVEQAEGFNYSISHDLRAPLRAMVSSASIVLEEASEKLSEEHRQLLERQAFNANRLAILIDELLRLSRLARVAVRRETIDMTEIARTVASEFPKTCEIVVQEGMTAEADRSLVRMVLENLIGNARKFSPNGCAISVGEEDGAFFVRDQGIGFDMIYEPKIFLPFERLVLEQEFPGTGIGLANVRRVIDRHGGRVWAKSVPNEGSTFYFTLGAN